VEITLLFFRGVLGQQLTNFGPAIAGKTATSAFLTLSQFFCRDVDSSVTRIQQCRTPTPFGNFNKSMNSFNPAVKTAFVALAAGVCLLFAGCQTPPTAALSPSPENAVPDPAIILREGDAVKISFAGAKQLDTEQIVRRDGKIVLPTFGEIQASGLTPAQLEKQILTNFGPQLVTKEITVTLQSSQYPVFVNGAVLRPGKIEPTRPITVLEAVMEAGGFDYAKANLKSVRVIRTEGSEVKTYTVDLRGALAGKPSVPFYVRRSDIIFVPEKFTVF